MKFASLFLAVTPLLLGANQSFAALGNGTSGGGKGVVCRDTHGKVKSVELLDFWEARTIYGRKLEKASGSIPAMVKQAVKSLSESLPMDDLNYEVLNPGETEPHKVQGAEAVNMSLLQQASPFVDRDDRSVHRLRHVNLTPTDDSYESARPTGCAVEQIVRYEDSGKWAGTVLINQDLYDRLDAVNQAALITHEALYKWLRDMFGEQSSLRVRRAVGLAFSGYEFHTVHENSIRGSYYNCYTPADNDGTNDQLVSSSKLVMIPVVDANGTLSADFRFTYVQGAPIFDNAFPPAPAGSNPPRAFGDLTSLKGYGSSNLEENTQIQPDLHDAFRVDEAGPGFLKVSISAQPSVFLPKGLKWTPATCTLQTNP